MTTPLHVLIVEDSEDDTQLMLRQLRSGGYDPRWERVDTPEAMTSSLDREQWDVILCDYRMPRFNAPAALKLVQERKANIPFIIVSGTIGEDTAIDAMKSGAHDYLMKNNLSRLVVAIEREMREARTRHEKKKAEEDLQLSEQNFRHSLDDSPLGIRIVSADGKMLYANQTILDIYGYDSIEELRTTPHKEIYTPQSYAEHLVRKEQRQRGEYVASNYEISIIRNHGKIRHLDVFRKEVLWNGEPQFQVLYSDITERKRAEEALLASEERFRIATESTSDCVWEWDIEKASRDWFGDIDSLLGYRRDEFPRTMDAWEKAIHPDDHDKVMALLDKHIVEHTPYDAKYRIVKKDGSIAFWVDRGTALLDENGKAYKMIGSVKDITEQKKAEEALKKSTQLLRDTGEMAKVGGWEVDVKTQAQVWTEEIYRIHEVAMTYKPTVDKGTDFYAPTSRPVIERAMQRAIEHDEPFDVELEFITAKGNLRWVHAIGKADKEHGKVSGTFQDITERKKAEEKLFSFRMAMDSATDAIGMSTPEGKHYYQNKAFTELFGLSANEVDGSSGPPSTVYADENVGREVFATIMAGDSFVDEVKMFGKDRREKDILLRAYSIKDKEGKIVGLVGIHTDITERKQAEEKIQSQLEELKRWQNVMLGREDRVQELKREVNELYRRMGKAVRYASQKDAPADPGTGTKEHK